MNNDILNFVWAEKYRPKTIETCILPVSIKSTFQEIVKSGNIQNMLLSGPPGCGKTTAARALCEQLNYDYLFINASDDRNIDTLRTTVRTFASTTSMEGRKKAVIFDEADYLNPQSTQPAMRAFFEEFAGHCSFILTCNFEKKIIDPLKSRLSSISFHFTEEDKKTLSSDFYKRLLYILEQEKVIVSDKKALALYVLKYFPDFRKAIIELQRACSSGTFDASTIHTIKNTKISELFDFMKSKSFTEVRKWIANNISEQSPTHIIHSIFTVLDEKVQKKSIPTAILLLSEYDYRLAFTSDPEITMAALFAQMMLEVEYL